MGNGIEFWGDFTDAHCVTVTKGNVIGAAERLANADLQEFAGSEAAQAWVDASADYTRAWFATGTVDGWTFAWEPNGFQGTTPEVALRLAQGTSLVSASWNVNGQMQFLLMDGGTVIRQFDPLFHDDAEPPAWFVGRALDAEAALDWLDAPIRSSLVLLAETARIREVGPQWLATPGARFWGHNF